MECFARLVRILLGPDSVAVQKLACGLQLEVLGILISIDENGFRCEPAPRKVKKWLFDIDVVLSECRLLPGAASKMAGRLSWGSSHMFRKVGRAMLRAIFDQKTRKDGHLSIELEESLRWWKVVFQCGIAEVKEWEPPPGKPCTCSAMREAPQRDWEPCYFSENNACLLKWKRQNKQYRFSKPDATARSKDWSCWPSPWDCQPFSQF